MKIISIVPLSFLIPHRLSDRSPDCSRCSFSRLRGTLARTLQQLTIKRCHDDYQTTEDSFARASSNLNDFNYRNKALTAKLLRQGYRYFKLRKAFSKFYRRHSALLEKYSVSLKTLLQQGISETEFYGDLVYRFRKIVGKSNFSEQFRKLINRYKRIGYSLDIMRQTACLVVNPIIVDGYASLFNCTTAVRASDSMTASS